MKIIVTVQVDSEVHGPAAIQEKLANLLQSNMMIGIGLKGSKVKVLTVRAEPG